MANIKQQVDEMFAELDTAVAMTGKIKEIVDFYSTLSLTLNLSANVKPFELIMQLLKRLGITYDELLEWTSMFLTAFLPTIEIGVKAALLANLKGLVSCSIDPRIPDKFRKVGTNTAGTSDGGVGINIALPNVDYFNKLSISPFSKEGKYKYFGTSGMTSAYELVRANDMDAFLWFAVNKGKFPSTQNWGDWTNMTVTEGESFLEPVTLQLNNTGGTNSSKIMVGNVFAHNNGKVIAMCYQSLRKYDEENGYEKVVTNKLLPISSDASSLNWYTSKHSLNLIENKDRDFTNEVAICNFNYEHANAYSSAENVLRVSLLPKPAQHIPDITDSTQSLLSYRKLRFNAKGEPDPKGRFSYVQFEDNGYSTEGEWLTKSLTGGVKFAINKKTGEYTISDKKKNIALLQECYPGLTVFEFNYDYVTSLRLFDAKVVTASIFDALLNLNIGVSTHTTKAIPLYKEEEFNLIKDIIENIINSDDSEINDCFYSFSNDKYDAQLRKAQEKRLQQQRFGNVTYTQTNTDIIANALDEYDNAPTLHGKTTALKRAIRQASVIASSNSAEEDKNDVQINFLFDFIQQLIVTIIDSVFSPKVMILLAVNSELMGNDVFKNLKDFTDIVKTLQNLLRGIIKGIKDLLLQELMKLVIKYLNPIVESMTAMLAQEVVSQYTTLIRQLIKNCDMSYFFALLALFKRNDSDTILDNVDYPDIDTSTITNDTPKTNC